MNGVDFGIPSTANALKALYHKAEPTLSDEELKWLGSLGSVAEDKAKWLGSVCESIGCLVNQDGEQS